MKTFTIILFCVISLFIVGCAPCECPVEEKKEKVYPIFVIETTNNIGIKDTMLVINDEDSLYKTIQIYATQAAEAGLGMESRLDYAAVKLMRQWDVEEVRILNSTGSLQGIGWRSTEE